MPSSGLSSSDGGDPQASAGSGGGTVSEEQEARLTACSGESDGYRCTAFTRLVVSLDVCVVHRSLCCYAGWVVWLFLTTPLGIRRL